MASLRRLQHVDRKDIYTNLEARIQYLHSFLDFSSSDIQALTQGSKYIIPLIPSLITKIYNKLLQYDITAASFRSSSTSTSSTSISSTYFNPNITPDPSQVAYRKLFMRGYLQNLISSPTTPEYWAYLNKVGQMHSSYASPNLRKLNVEYIHISACLGFIQDCLNEAILSHPRLKIERKIAIVRALGKVIWIQNDLFAKWYVRDGEEFRTSGGEQGRSASPRKRESLEVFEEELLRRAEEFSPIGREVGSPMEEWSQCPFSGLKGRMDGMRLEGREVPFG